MSVTFHSSDGLSLSLPRSVILATCSVVKHVLWDTCPHEECHVTVDADSQTLLMFADLVQTGQTHLNINDIRY